MTWLFSRELVALAKPVIDWSLGIYTSAEFKWSNHSELVPVFLGMGLYEFSMSPLHVLPTKKLIRELNYEECQELVPRVLAKGSSQEIKNFMRDFLSQKKLL